MYTFLENNGYFNYIDKSDVFIMEQEIFSSFSKAIEKTKKEIDVQNSDEQNK